MRLRKNQYSELLTILGVIQNFLSVEFSSYGGNYDLIRTELSSIPDNTKKIIDLKLELADQKNIINTKSSQFNESVTILKSLCENEFFNDINETDFTFIYNQALSLNALTNQLKSLYHSFNNNAKNTKIKLTHKDGKVEEITALNNTIITLAYDCNVVNRAIIRTLDEAISKVKLSEKIIINSKEKIKEDRELDYQKRFEEESQLVIKKFNHEVENLLKGFRNEIASFKLDQNSLTKRNLSLTKELEENLKNIKNINEKTQNLDLTLSKIVNSENIKIVEELNQVKLKAEELISPIILEIEEKKTGIETTYSDFKNLVENAGIYDLTKNYKDKADEEKEEYRTYRKHTTNAIIAAIVSTLAIFVIAFIEHAIASQEAQTNYLLLVSRLSISLMFFVLALYLSKQAAKHYECYQENHRTFLQLAALEPFMARMTPEEQKEIRKGLIPSYFNQANDEKYPSKGEEVSLPEAFKNLPDKIVEAINTRTNPSSNS